ncbi:unnamed protein product [Aureobasidium uvarum]|uniref:Uncharacterized protein n=1 Tax=Aureobasidium uvarum TaxID=2773716 RepID=A0A9N8PS27_9PEZI|nr:unnamed protein product [Aureobasidium uvarum]
MHDTVATNTRLMNSGMAYWTSENTIPAGPQNAPPSQQQTRRKGRLARLCNFLRLDSNSNDHARSCGCIRCLQVRGQLNIQVFQEPQPSFSPGTPRRAPTPPRRRNSSPQISRTSHMPQRPMAKRYQTEMPALSSVRSLTPPDLPSYILPQPIRDPIRRKPLPPGVSTFVSAQPLVQSPAVPQPSDPVSPISPSALNFDYNSAPISPISMTATEPDFDQARINRMSTYSYLDGYTDLSAFATTPYADTFAAAGSAAPAALTKESSTTVNGTAMKGFILRTATPVSFQKAKPIKLSGPVRKTSVTRTERPELTLQIRSVPVSQPEIIRRPSINSLDCVAGSESERSSSNVSIAGAFEESSDNGSLGTHARILKRVLVESLEARSLVRDPFVPK